MTFKMGRQCSGCEKKVEEVKLGREKAADRKRGKRITAKAMQQEKHTSPL